MARTFGVDLKEGVGRDTFRESLLSKVYRRWEDGGLVRDGSSIHIAVEPTEKDTHAHHTFRANIVVTFGDDRSYYNWSAFSPAYFGRLSGIAFDAGARRIAA